MKLVRLASDPGLNGVRLNTNPSGDTGNSYLVGYGVGRASSSLLSSSPVTWGDSSTALKRWGTNLVDGTIAGVQVGDTPPICCGPSSTAMRASTKRL